jgi:hypothetical protein
MSIIAWLVPPDTMMYLLLNPPCPRPPSDSDFYCSCPARVWLTSDQAFCSSYPVAAFHVCITDSCSLERAVYWCSSNHCGRQALLGATAHAHSQGPPTDTLAGCRYPALQHNIRTLQILCHHMHPQVAVRHTYACAHGLQQKLLQQL